MEDEIFTDLAEVFHNKWTGRVFFAALHWVAMRDQNPRGRAYREATDRLMAAVRRENE